LHRYLYILPVRKTKGMKSRQPLLKGKGKKIATGGQKGEKKGGLKGQVSMRVLFLSWGKKEKTPGPISPLMVKRAAGESRPEEEKKGRKEKEPGVRYHLLLIF